MEGVSQTASADTMPSSYSPATRPQKFYIPHKLDYGIQVGTQFTASSYASGFSTFVSPHLSYGLSKRFSLSGGVTIINTTLNGQYYTPFTSETFGNTNFTTATVFLSGQYLLNDKVTITGSAYKQFNVFGKAPGYSSFGNNDAHGIYLDVHYKITDHISIEGSFGYSQGNSLYDYYRHDPFNRTIGDPFFRP